MQCGSSNYKKGQNMEKFRAIEFLFKETTAHKWLLLLWSSTQTQIMTLTFNYYALSACCSLLFAFVHCKHYWNGNYLRLQFIFNLNFQAESFFVRNGLKHHYPAITHLSLTKKHEKLKKTTLKKELCEWYLEQSRVKLVSH